MNVLRIAAAVIVDDEGRMLMVRKAGTTAFMQPGGKLEPGEAADECLVRELQEELGIVVSPASFEHVGRFDAPAANEAGFVVDCDVYRVWVSGSWVAAAQAEIAEVRWFTREELSGEGVAPLTRANVGVFLGA